MRVAFDPFAISSSIPSGMLLAALFLSFTDCHNDKPRPSGVGPSGGQVADATADVSHGQAPDQPPPLSEDDPYVDWVAVAWAGRECLWTTASNSLGFGRLRWIECNAPTAGCRYLDVSNIEGGRTYPGEKIFGFRANTLNDGALRLSISAIFPDYRLHGVVDRNNAQLIAWKAENGCGMHTPQVHLDGRVSVIVTQPDRDNYGYVAGSRIAFDSIESLLTPSPFIVDVAVEDFWGFKASQNVTMVYQASFGPRTAAFYAAPPPRILSWDYQNRPTRVEISDLASEASRPIVVGDEIVFEQYGNPDVRGFFVRRNNGHVDPLYTKPSSWPGELLADDNAFVWQEAVDHGDGTFFTELWTAPLSTTRPWNARKVGQIGPREFYQAAFGEGFFAYRIDSNQIGLIRVADGAKFLVPAPEGFGWMSVEAVAGGEIWGRLHLNPGGRFYYTVARIPIASVVK